MAAKSVFVSAKSQLKKKKVFMIRGDLISAITEVEKTAEIHGITFNLNELVEGAIDRLVKQAQSELDAISSSQNTKSALLGSADYD